jgi:hypothetical protein
MSEVLLQEASMILIKWHNICKNKVLSYYYKLSLEAVMNAAKLVPVLYQIIPYPLHRSKLKWHCTNMVRNISWNIHNYILK